MDEEDDSGGVGYSGHFVSEGRWSFGRSCVSVEFEGDGEVGAVKRP